MDRRAFLTSLAGGWLVHTLTPASRPLSGRIVGASHAAGHLLRTGAAPQPGSPPHQADVVIVGSGVSGLSAAWRLAPAGLDVCVIELEPRLGGTSSYGEDGVVAYPWGAHYLAAPNPQARAALRLLHQINAVTGWDAAGRPVFDPRLLCHSPQERLFYQGHWHPGLVPLDALSPLELQELTSFIDYENEMTERLGTDGLPAFQIPVELSSRDPEFIALDAISMAEWLDRQGYRTPFVRWYVRYAMLDDFGGLPEDISAWAGLNYFCARKLQTPQLEGSHFLVWPEGNGRLVRALHELASPRVLKGALVTQVKPLPKGDVEVDYVDVAQGHAHRIHARAVILAVPAFIVRRILPTADTLVPRTSSPWLVANLHVTWPPDPNLPWDSVLFDALGLGYVDAHHQLTFPAERTVLTYYRAYGDADVAQARATLLGASWDSLANDILQDLSAAHPHLHNDIERMDIMIWGHGMPRPRPGFLGTPPFEAPCALHPTIAWAHVDQSGLALFEEAQLRGVRAAETVGAAMGLSLGESWL